MIYLDNNSTTPMLPAVREAMEPYLTGTFGNPSSAHQAGRHARRALEDAREKVASLLNAHADEVVFTSGATEANNLALFCLAGAPPTSRDHIISSPIEHPSVAEPLQRLAKLGCPIDYLPVDREGVVVKDALGGLLRPETRLVCVMLANNETGSVQPVAELVQMLDRRAWFHCDAVQAVGRVPINFRELGLSCLSLSAHKIHGPKGIGALIVRRGTRLQPLLLGGHQQQGKRPGTEPVALAVGLASALELACRHMAANQQKVTQLRRRFLAHLREHAAPVMLNGSEEDGLPHTLNLSFPGCRADALLMNLDLAGIACSTGSACSSGSLLPSPVLQAMNVPDPLLNSAMRFSLSPLLTEQEIDEASGRISAVVSRLRASGVA